MLASGKCRILLAGLALVCVLAPAAGRAQVSSAPAVLVEEASAQSFDQTLARLKEALAKENLMVVNAADHQAMVGMMEVKIPPSQTLDVFHPRYGATIFRADPRAAIEAPLKIGVREGTDGKTVVSYFQPSSLFARYRGLEELGKELDGVLERIVTHATATGGT